MTNLPLAPGHRPTRAIVDRSAFCHNIDAAKARAGSDVMAIVKSNGYGHGMIELAREAVRHGVAGLGVATADEALCLRETKGFAETVILVMGPTRVEDTEALQKAQISVAIGTDALLDAHFACAARLGITPKLHLKLNTGMNRYGFTPDRTDVLENFAAQPMALAGLMTHYSVSDSTDDDQVSYTKNQQEKFKAFATLARSAGMTPKLHASNSGAVIYHPEESFDFTRPGMMLYGANPEPAYGPLDDLRPVMTWATQVAAIYEYAEGAELSYGRSYSMPKDGRIALLPVGYGDGVPRRLSNKGNVLIGGKRAPIAGRVCMDQILVNVTDIPNVSPGDEVILVGRQANEQITLEEVALQVESIPYEITCQMTSRVPRVYIR